MKLHILGIAGTFMGGVAALALRGIPLSITAGVGFIALSGVVVKTTNDYFKRLKSGEITDKGDGRSADGTLVPDSEGLS